MPAVRRHAGGGLYFALRSTAPRNGNSARGMLKRLLHSFRR